MSRLDAYLAEKLQIKSEQLSRQAIEAWQLKAMNDLLTWCKQHSSYYSFLSRQAANIGKTWQHCLFDRTNTGGAGTSVALCFAKCSQPCGDHADIRDQRSQQASLLFGG